MKFIGIRPAGLLDIDNTSYEGYLMVNLILQQHEERLIPQQIFDSMVELYFTHLDGKLGYENLVSEILPLWARGLEGKTVKEVSVQTRKFLDSEEGDKFYPFVAPLINRTKTTHLTLFVTAEPEFVAEYTAKRFGAAGYVSTIFEVRWGEFTGEVARSLATEKDKLNALLKERVAWEGSFALGDSEADSGMLRLVGRPVCVNTNPALSKIAEANGWPMLTPELVYSSIDASIRSDFLPRGKER